MAKGLAMWNTTKIIMIILIALTLATLASGVILVEKHPEGTDPHKHGAVITGCSTFILILLLLYCIPWIRYMIWGRNARTPAARDWVTATFAYDNPVQINRR